MNMKFPLIEVGSISEASNHVSKVTYWRWGVDVMPLMEHGGRPPSGQALTRACHSACNIDPLSRGIGVQN